MDTGSIMREQLLALLHGGNAHLGFENAVADFPVEHFNTKPPGVDYTPWHIVEQLRIDQWDILEFIRNPNHQSPPWPKGYWPAPHEQADEARWQQTLNAFRADVKALQALTANPKTNLYAAIPHAPNYTVLREILVVPDHNSYHIGEFAVLRQVMNTWPNK